MLIYIRYTLAALCLAASVACLALWWRSIHHYRFLQFPSYVTGMNLRVTAIHGLFNVVSPSDLPHNEWRYESFQVSPDTVTKFMEPLDGRCFGKRTEGGTHWVFFPLWYTALVFALASVGILRVGRFTIRTALVGMTIVAVLLGMVVVL